VVEEGSAPGLLRGRVLVVDDNPENVALIRAQLHRAGHTVAVASSGQAGLEAALAAPPDVVLLDVMMPGMDGYEVCRRLRADPRTHALPIVILTALHDRTDKIRALEAGADEFLSKPVDRAELLARVGSLLRLKRTYDQLAAERTRLAAQLAVAEVHAAVSTLDEAARQVLTEICTTLKWDLGLIWRTDERGEELHCVDVWHREGVDVSEMQRLTRELRYPADQGLLGHAWTRREPRWLADVTVEPGFRRAEAALAAGLHGAFWFPIVASGETVGVMEFFSREIAQPDAHLLAWMDAIGQQIGQYVERHRAQEALRASERRLEEQRNTLDAVMTSMSDGLLVVAADGMLRYCNRRAGELLGMDPSEALGRPIEAALDGVTDTLEDPDATRAAWQQALPRVDQRPQFESVITQPLRRELLNELFPILSADGEHEAVGVLIRDVTQERAAERLKDELVSVVSHELRTPLASMVGFAELLLVRPFEEPERREFLTIMLEEGRRLTALINDFLDLQRMESARQAVSAEPTDVGSVIARAVTAAGPDDAHPTVIDLAEGLPEVMADGDRVIQVVTNLLSNARKFSPAGGAVEVRATLVAPPADVRAVEVSIKDQGLGLPPEALARLFEKFYRVDNSDRREIKGTGLGLAICRQIVEGHGGRIWVESEGLGHGACFKFTLPVADARTVGGDVLVVEDDAGFARLLEEELAALHLTSAHARTAEAARARLATERPRAVVLDLILPGQDGDQLLPDLRQALGPFAPVVVVTVKDLSAAEQRDLVDRGVSAVLRKGPGVAALAARTVSDVMQRAGAVAAA
jgi:PAS domain S-box-containing protein